MDGFSVLNTLGGGVTMELYGWAMFLIGFLGIVGGASLLSGLEEESGGMVSFGLCFLVIVGVLIFSGVAKHEVPQPTRYEVTVNPGHVIDAARWEIVEQRGEIYVIQSRKGADADE
ncbi:hypothetical protein [Paenibacillus pinihumi]|uniref:hypothetical protein n=1 Tax=Paenibacillus pinihumi TaxID=669462 RepID=UPI000427C6BC|nr:hypothetical protein [Paenibacillus pinihumi]